VNLTTLFTKFGFKPPTRDALMWLWFQAIGVASLVVANTADLPAWAAYLGFTLTVVWVHRLSVLATVILYLGGRYGKSPLPGAPK
jgi:hypothetical protein